MERLHTQFKPVEALSRVGEKVPDTHVIDLDSGASTGRRYGARARGQVAALTSPELSDSLGAQLFFPGLYMCVGRGWAGRLISSAWPGHCLLLLAMWNLEFKGQLCS